MHSSYFTLLYSECKRLSNAPVDIEQIKEFIKSPEGQRGLVSFIASRQTPKGLSRLKSIGDVLGELP